MPSGMDPSEPTIIVTGLAVLPDEPDPWAAEIITEKLTLTELWDDGIEPADDGYQATGDQR